MAFAHYGIEHVIGIIANLYIIMLTQHLHDEISIQFFGQGAPIIDEFYLDRPFPICNRLSVKIRCGRG